jgi:hypothetical protein
MSNANIIQKMRETCDRWDAGEIDSNQLKNRIVGLAEALEGVKHSIVEQARELEGRIVFASGYGNFEGLEKAITELKIVLAKLREWINTLPK